MFKYTSVCYLKYFKIFSPKECKKKKLFKPKKDVCGIPQRKCLILPSDLVNIT